MERPSVPAVVPGIIVGILFIVRGVFSLSIVPGKSLAVGGL